MAPAVLHAAPGNYAVVTSRANRTEYASNCNVPDKSFKWPHGFRIYHDLPPHPSLSHCIQVSRRVIATDQPVIMKTKQLMARAPAGEQVLSLAQGNVHWQPPPAALEVASRLLQDGDAGDIWLQDIIERVYVLLQCFSAICLTASSLPCLSTGNSMKSYIMLILHATTTTSGVSCFCRSHLPVNTM